MELLALSTAELDRLRTLQRVPDGYLTQRQAAARLGLSERQVRRLIRAFEKQGPAAVASKRRGRAPNNRISSELRARIIERYRCDYRGFGPTLLAQTLAERDRISVSRETLRALLVENGLWQASRRRVQRHPLRERRPCFGELIQMDGSPHAWFEQRAPEATLLLAVDDASSRITAGRFETAETTDGYFRLMRSHIEKYGRFVAAYTDKHSIFRYSGSTTDEPVVTQLQRALDELDIELICANSPQAKGRVERANRTMQDRLVKALRLTNISTIEQANIFLTTFIEQHNARFAVEPISPHDTHRSIAGLDIDTILCRREERVVTKNLMFQLDDAYYALIDSYSRRCLTKGSRVTILQHPDGRTSVLHDQHLLTAERTAKVARAAPIVGAKDLNARFDRRTPDPRKVRVPAANHPWKTYRKPSRVA